VVGSRDEPTLHISAAIVPSISTLPVELRDTVDAGDTFACALAASIAEGEDWDQAIWRSNVAAALDCRTPTREADPAQ
jgi:sugar/nucleoside kinase (ribokinase family)